MLLLEEPVKGLRLMGLGKLFAVLLVSAGVFLTPILASSQVGQPDDSAAEGQTCTITPAQEALLDLHNESRNGGAICANVKKRRVPSLRWSCRLAAASRRHAQDMLENEFLGHQGSDGSTIGDRAKEAGYQWNNIGENAAEGFVSTDSVYQAWLSSGAHCESIMNRAYQDFGATKMGRYWVVMFGRRSAAQE